jgi:hypothetical protein
VRTYTPLLVTRAIEARLRRIHPGSEGTTAA